MGNTGSKPGVYLTTYGNAAVVISGETQLAYDLDMGEVIPMSEVTMQKVRDLDSADEGLAEERIEDFREGLVE